MGKAFKCDMTGEMVEGDALDNRFVDVDIAENQFLRCHLYVRESAKRNVEGVMGPKAKEQIRKALTTKSAVVTKK